MKFIKKEKYEGLGFVEALIAIMVSGIVATVLINISVVAMRELVRLDIDDAQAHHARSAAVIVQNIANRERLKEDSTLFDSLNIGSCYTLTKNGDSYDISTSALASDRETYKTEGVITDGVNDNEQDYFRIVCIVKNRPGNPPTNKLLVKVIIGFNKAEGLFSNSSDIRDYSYLAIINL